VTAMLELLEVSKSYGKDATLVHALIGADMTVDLGELVAVMARAGRARARC
jgi:ABC-type lipoprotein export system ATPase subunit